MPHLSVVVTHCTQSSRATLAPLKVYIQTGHKLSCPHVLLHTLSFLEEHSKETQDGEPQHSLLETSPVLTSFIHSTILLLQKSCAPSSTTKKPRPAQVGNKCWQTERACRRVTRPQVQDQGPRETTTYFLSLHLMTSFLHQASCPTLPFEIPSWAQNCLGLGRQEWLMQAHHSPEQRKTSLQQSNLKRAGS